MIVRDMGQSVHRPRIIAALTCGAMAQATAVVVRSRRLVVIVVQMRNAAEI